MLEEAAFYGIALPYICISDALCDEQLLRATMKFDFVPALNALRDAILALWLQRIAEGNRKLAYVVLDEVCGKGYRYFSLSNWSELDDLGKEEERGGIPYVQKPPIFAALQHECVAAMPSVGAIPRPLFFFLSCLVFLYRCVSVIVPSSPSNLLVCPSCFA